MTAEQHAALRRDLRDLLTRHLRPDAPLAVEVDLEEGVVCFAPPTRAYLRMEVDGELVGVIDLQEGDACSAWVALYRERRWCPFPNPREAAWWVLRLRQGEDLPTGTWTAPALAVRDDPHVRAVVADLNSLIF